MTPESETTEEAIHRGIARARVYDWPGAVDSFRRAVALDPENVAARFRLGWALWNQAEDEKPTLADMAVAYGAGLVGLEQTARDGKRKFQAFRARLKDACHYLRSGIERDPNHAAGHFYLAKCLAAQDRKVEAGGFARTAALLEPGNSAYRDLARSLEQVGAARPAPDEPPAPGAALTWDDLVINPRTRRELRQMQLMMEQPDLAQSLGVQPPTGILLKGPPGTGKTTVARILANEAKCRFYSITPADIHQMYVGESEKRVRDLFAKARATAPSIIFIDEIDAMLPLRQGGIAIHSDKVVNQFLQEMDGIKPNSRVFVIGATNRPDMLDPALRRGGRLSREIEIPMPDLEARRALVKVITRGAVLDDAVDMEELANRTEDYSGADIRALVNEAGLQALIRISEGGAAIQKSLTMVDFEAALLNLG